MRQKYLTKQGRRTYLVKSREEEMKRALEEVFRASYLSLTPILDVGASEGKTFELFREMYGNACNYFATELDFGLAKNLIKKGVDEVVLCTAYNLPFRSNSFNVLSLNVVNWKPMDQVKYLYEMLRVFSEVLMISFYTKIFQQAKKRFKGEIKSLSEQFKKEFEKISNSNNVKLMGNFRDENGILELYKIEKLG